MSRTKVVSIIKIVEKGYYAPKTAYGNIFVNDIYASCYSNIDNDVMNQFFKNLKHMIISSWIEHAINEFQISLNQNEVSDWTSLFFQSSFLIKSVSFFCSKNFSE